MARTLHLADVAALLAVAQDHSFGQPPGAQLRATVLGQWLAESAGVSEVERAATWWTSALRFLGCTGHAYDTAVVFGDEIELRAASLQADPSSPAEFLRLMLQKAGPGRSGLRRLASIVSVVAGGRKAAELNFRMACEVADAFAARLRLDDAVRSALAANFERWNGRGLPHGIKGDEIPLPMRVAQLAQELEVLCRVEGVTGAVQIVSARKGKAYDPALADVAVAHAAQWWDAVEPLDPWDAALALAPARASLGGTQVDQVLLLLADFADLKSPWTSGHSRAVAQLTEQACGAAGRAPALLHDLGRVAVANTVWDKRGPLTRDERDRMESHTLVTEQLLRRTPYFAALAAQAGAAHERGDASGYHRRAGGAQLDDVQRVLAAADAYQAMCSDRPHRQALEPALAARELRAMVADGRLDGGAVERVLVAAGHRRAARPALPAGLTAREIDVLRLLAVGHTTRQVADKLVISTKTADHHIQHIYTKIGVSTRGAAALFAIEHGLLPAGR